MNGLTSSADELDDVRVTEIPRGPALVLPPEASIAGAVEAMRRRGRGAAVVVRNHRPIGVLTDRDILGWGRPAGVLTDRDILGWGRQRSQARADLDDPRLPVASVMTPCTEALREGDTVAGALRSMCARRQWHLPIVCDQGLLLGALDIADISLWLRDRMTLSTVAACFPE
jgi:CBS domain-containing protein